MYFSKLNIYFLFFKKCSFLIVNFLLTLNIIFKKINFLKPLNQFTSAEKKYQCRVM